MPTVKPQVLKGFRDYLPEQTIPRQKVINVIRSVFETYGYSPLETPALEYSEILLGKYGQEGEKQFYRFRDNGGRDICLKYDLTVPLARLVAQYPEIPKPFRRYHIAQVWRAEKPQKGRFREFYQCDIDIVGTKSILADAECVKIDSEILTALGVKKFQIRVNNRMVLNGLMRLLGIENERLSADVFRNMDKVEKIGMDGLRKILIVENQLSAEIVGKIEEYLEIDGDPRQVLSDLEKFFSDDEIGTHGVNALKELLEYTNMMGVPHDQIKIDTRIARGLDYYTGTVFETFLMEMPGLGSVMSGGRYDKLVGMFTDEDIPATGISIGLDRLFSGLEELNLVELQKTTAKVLVAFFEKDLLSHALRLVNLLRDSKINIEVYPEGDKLAKQFKYADKKEIPFVMMQGSDEVENKVVTVRDMISGQQSTVQESEIVDFFRNKLKLQ